MIKTLIATGLITTNIMGAISSNNFSGYYQDQGWQPLIINSEEVANSKVKMTAPNPIQNGVVSITSKSFTYIYEMDGGDVQRLESATLTKIELAEGIDELTDLYITFSSVNQPDYITNYNEASIQENGLYKMASNSTLYSSLISEASFNYDAYTEARDNIVADGTLLEYNGGTDAQKQAKYSNTGQIHLEDIDRTTYIFNFIWIDNWHGYGTGEPYDLSQNFYPYVPNQMTGSYVWEHENQSQEIIDIPGLLYEILAMPFAFMSYAFNLTLWPGTQYAINLSHVFLALIVSGIIIFIIKKVYK